MAEIFGVSRAKSGVAKFHLDVSRCLYHCNYSDAPSYKEKQRAVSRGRGTKEDGPTNEAFIATGSEGERIRRCKHHSCGEADKWARECRPKETATGPAAEASSVQRLGAATIEETNNSGFGGVLPRPSEFVVRSWDGWRSTLERFHTRSQDEEIAARLDGWATALAVRRGARPFPPPVC